MNDYRRSVRQLVATQYPDLVLKSKNIVEGADEAGGEEMDDDDAQDELEALERPARAFEHDEPEEFAQPDLENPSSTYLFMKNVVEGAMRNILDA